MDSTDERVQDQLDYYERSANTSQQLYRGVKVAQLVVAAAVPVAAAADADPVLTAGLGAVILILEGIQALFGWQQNWLNYRNTAEALKSERFLFNVKAGPYARAKAAEQLFAERIEALLATERTSWLSAQLPPDEQH